MSKEYYRKRLVDLRADIAREREAKKKDNASYASRIKAAVGTYNKTYYRKLKIEKSCYHDRKIESLKREVERTRESLKRAR